MPRYYFHVRTPETLITDDEGAILPDVPAAREEAELSARGLVADAVRKGRSIDGQTIEVTSEGGDTVLICPLRDAAKLN